MDSQVLGGVASRGFDSSLFSFFCKKTGVEESTAAATTTTSISASEALRVGGVAFREVGGGEEGDKGTVVLRLQGCRIMSGMLFLILAAHSLFSSREGLVCHL